jgi:DNA-binding transcriptional LysR family regulator
VGLYGPGLAQLAPEIVDAFLARHPGVTVRVEQEPWGNDVEALRRGAVDVALVRAPVTVLYRNDAPDALVTSFVQTAVDVADGRRSPVPRAEALA